MEAVAAAKASRDAISGVPSNFMLDGKTYERGAALGFQGADFYAAGRGGVLGPCDADVVAAAFVWFEPSFVRRAWEATASVMPRDEAAAEFAACAEAWAEAHIADGVDCARLAALAGDVIDAASPAMVPLFAGWRRMPVPSSPKAAALHQLNVLRELRGGLHGAAAIAAGLSPAEALAVSSPHMAPLFGWSELPPVDDPLRETWQRAEDATNVAMGRALGALDEQALDEFVSVAQAFAAAVDGQPG